MANYTVLPDGSAFSVMSFPLPEDHWLYTPREYASDEAVDPIDLPAPILTHALRENVIAAVRYAIRASTNCGQENDFDPDAMVQNAVYALCGPTQLEESDMDYEFVPGRDDFPPDEIAMLRQQLAAALAACEAKDAVLNGIKLYRAFNGDDWPSREAITALVIKPDASALKAHDEALIEKVISRAEDFLCDAGVPNYISKLRNERFL